MKYTTEQEQLWASSFGDEYILRNKSKELLYSKIGMFSKMLQSAVNINSVREFGCNIGLNLLAIRSLKPNLNLFGIEINQKAAMEAQKLKIAEIIQGTALDNYSNPKVDLVMSIGFLIHVNPLELTKVYENLYSGSKRYILLAEYFNPNPITIEYRGNTNALFKRDFASELISKYDLDLIDYGFIYHKDNWIPQDNLNWFLLQKRK